MFQKLSLRKRALLKNVALAATLLLYCVTGKGVLRGPQTFVRGNKIQESALYNDYCVQHSTVLCCTVSGVMGSSESHNHLYKAIRYRGPHCTVRNVYTIILAMLYSFFPYIFPLPIKHPGLK